MKQKTKPLSTNLDHSSSIVTNEESRRPGIREIIAILKGEEEPLLSKRKKSSFLGNGCVIDCYSQLQQTNNEMKSHLALVDHAMLQLQLHCIKKLSTMKVTRCN